MMAHATSPTIDGRATMYEGVLLRIGLNTKTSWLMRRSSGEQGVRTPPLKNHKNKGFLRNTGSDPLKITKLQSQLSMLGHHWPVSVSETPFKWHFSGGPMMARLSDIWIVFPLSKKKEDVVRVGPPLAKLSGSTHGCLNR